MNDSIMAAAGEMQRWGMNNSQPVTQDYCAQVYEVLVRNYPCMKEGVCMPYNDMTVVIVLIVVMGGLVLLGWMMHKWFGGKNVDSK